MDHTQISFLRTYRRKEKDRLSPSPICYIVRGVVIFWDRGGGVSVSVRRKNCWIGSDLNSAEDFRIWILSYRDEVHPPTAKAANGPSVFICFPRPSPQNLPQQKPSYRLGIDGKYLQPAPRFPSPSKDLIPTVGHTAHESGATSKK